MDGKRERETRNLRPQRRAKSDAGFAIAPILYMLGLIGIGAGVLFSGYSQILRSNVQVTNDLTTKNDLSAAGTTLSATSVLGTTDNTVLCPPQGGNASANCASAPVKMATFAAAASGSDASRLPANYANAGSTGSPAGFETGVFAAASGVKQFDGYGHYYIYCKWERAVSDGTDASIMVISAGPDGKLDTTCNDTAAQHDDTITLLPATVAINRSAVWQTAPAGGGGTQTQFGQVGTQLVVSPTGNLTVPGTITVAGAGTFNSTGTFTGNVTAPTFTGAFTGSTGDFTGNVAIGGTLGVTGATTLSTLSATNGAFSGTLGVTGNTTISGTLTSGAATLASATVTANEAVGGNLGVTGDATIGGAAVVTGALSGGSLTAGSSSQFGVDSYGNIVTSGTLHAGGSTLASLGVTGGETVGGALAVTGNTTGSNATYTGTVTATSFVGPLTGNVTGTSTNVTGVVAIANGGTGANNATTALANLGADNASNLIQGTLSASRLAANSIPGGDIENGTITATQLDTTTVTPGSYNWGTVDANGRVTYATNTVTNALTDGAGDSVVANTSGITFSTNNTAQAILDANGNFGLGTTSPHAKFDVVGNVRIENAAGTATPNQLQLMAGATSQRWAVTTDGAAEGGSTNGGSDFVVRSYSDVGTALGTPLTIIRATGAANFTGDVSANTYTGAGSGLTDIPASSIVGTITAGVALGTTTSLTNPSINGDTTTGFYTPSAAKVGVVISGTERVRWNSSGQSVNGDQTVTGNVIANGSIGVGTAVPATNLDVFASQGDIQIGNNSWNSYAGVHISGSAIPNLFIDANGTGDGNGPVLFFGLNGTAKWQFYMPSTSLGFGAYDRVSGAYAFYAAPSTDQITIGGSTSYNAPSILGQLDVVSKSATRVALVTKAAASQTANIQEWQNSSAGVLAEVAASGALGIGTSAPNAGVALDLGSNSTTADSSLLLPIGTVAARPIGINGMIRYASDEAAIEGYVANAWADILTSNSVITGGIVLGTSAANNNPYVANDLTSGLFSPTGSTVAVATHGLERLRVDASGNVGIGTTTALHMLDVNGTGGFTGAMTLTNTANNINFDTTTTNVGQHELNFSFQNAASPSYPVRIVSQAQGGYSRGDLEFWVSATNDDTVSATSSDAVLKLTGTAVTALHPIVVGALTIDGTQSSNNRIQMGTDKPSSAASSLLLKGGDAIYQNRGGGNLILSSGGNAGSGDGTGGFVIIEASQTTAAASTTNTVTEVARFLGNGRIGVGTATPLSSLDMSQRTDALSLPSGTTGDRPGTGVNGMIRYNSDSTPTIEGYINNAWSQLLSTSSSITGGVVLGTSATVANPYVASDLTSGLFSPAGSTVAITTNGLERFRVAANGNVGIGTGTPVSALDIHGSAPILTFDNGGTIDFDTAGNHYATIAPNYGSGEMKLGWLTGHPMYLTFYTSNNTGAERMRIDANGLVGIGTTVPASKLAVAGNVSVGTAYQNTAAPTDGMIISGNVGIGTATPVHQLSIGPDSGFDNYQSGTTANDSLKVVSNNLGASFATQNTNASGFSGVEYMDNTGAIAVFTGYNNASPGEFRFNNIASGGYITFKIGGSDKLTIANNGNVGIGTAAPGYLLHVSTAAGSGAHMRFEDTSTGTVRRMDFDPYNSSIETGYSGGFFTKLNLIGGGMNVVNSGGSGHTMFQIGDGTLSTNTIESGGNIAGLQYSALTFKSSYWPVTTATPAISFGTYNTAGSTDGLSRIDLYNGDTGAVVLQPNGGGVGIGTAVPRASLDMASRTDALALPSGTNGTRPAPALNGMIRYNQSNGKYEAYQANSWQDILTSAGSGSIIYLGTGLGSANPQIQNDATSGLYTPAGSTVAVVTNGTEALRVDGSQNVEIGTPAAQSGYKLTINGNAYASTTTGAALYAISSDAAGYGVYGKLTAAGNNTIAVYGGNAGAANTGSGVYGDNSSTGLAYGVYGKMSGAGNSGSAVAGNNTDAANTGYGVYGNNASTTTGSGVRGSLTGGNNSGAAVYADNSGGSNTGYAVYGANNSATGWGEYQAGSAPSYFNGNIGIGTAAPQYPLDIYHAGYFAAHFHNTVSTGQTSFYLDNDRGAFASYGGFLYGGSASTLGNLFGVTRTDKLFMFADGASNLGMWVGTLGAHPFVIGTNNAEVMRVTGAGNVGIGTATPASKFTVSSAGGANSGINLNLTSASSYATIDFNTPTGLVGQFVTTGSSFSNGIFGGDDLAFANEATNGATTIAAIGSNGIINFATGGSATSNERMRIDKNGNIGIGTAVPMASLDLSQKTDAVALPSGTNGTRPAAAINGMIRYNQTNGKYEAYQGNAWQDILTTSGAGSTAYLGTGLGSANPQIQNDATSGLYTPVGSTVAIVTNGIERLRVDASGNVGIGTATASSRFEIYDGTGTPTVTLYGYGAAGNVPTTPHVDFVSEGHGAYTPVVGARIEGNVTNGLSSINLYANNAAPALKEVWSFDGNGNLTQNALGAGGFSGSGITFNGSDAGGYKIIQVGAEGSTGWHGEDLKFKGGDANAAASGGQNIGGGVYIYGGTPASGGTYGNVLLADNGSGAVGKVGIGTATPGSTLDVNGSASIGYPGVAASSNSLIVSGTLGIGTTNPQGVLSPSNSIFAVNAASAGVDLTFSGNGYARQFFVDTSQGTDQKVYEILNYSGYFYISRINDGNTVRTYRLAISPSGAVGIGTGTPRAFLDLGASSDSLLLPSGTNGTRPAAAINGMIRYNQTNGKYEAYQGNAWQDILTTSGAGSTAYLGTGLGSANPQIQNDATSGLYTPVGSTVAIVTNGIERLRVDASGNVGIGTAAAQSGYIATLVGGLYSTMAAASGSAAVHTENTDPANTGFGIYAINASTKTAYGIYGAINGSNNSGYGVRGDNNDPGNTGYALYGKNNSAGTAYAVYGTMNGGGNSGYAGYFINDSTTGWSLYAAGASPNYFQSAVGIGTTHPRTSLDLGAETDAMLLPSGTTGTRPTGINGMIRYSQSNNAIEGYVGNAWSSLLASGTSITSGIVLGTSATVNNPQVASDITSGLFSPAGSTIAIATNGTERLRVGPTGNIGIGTATPLYKLTVIDSSSPTYSGVALQQIPSGTATPYSQATVGVGLSFLFGGNPIAAMYVSNSGIFQIETSAGDLGLGAANGGGGLGVTAHEFLGGNSLTTSPAFTTHIGGGKEAGYAGDASGNLFLITDRLQRVSVMEGTGYVGIATAAPRATLDIGAATDALILPSGTDGARPGTGINGMIRYSQSNNAIEGYVGNAWSSLLADGTTTGIYLGISTSAANPQISGDATSGLYSPAGSTVAVVTGGIERLRIDASGRVGIGTAAPVTSLDIHNGQAVTFFKANVDTSNSFLELSRIGSTSYDGIRLQTAGTTDWELGYDGTSGGSNANDFNIYNTNGGKPKFMIQSSTGNVGIGTAAPISPLTVYAPSLNGGGTNAGIYLAETTSGNGVAVGLDATKSGGHNYLFLASAGSASIGSGGWAIWDSTSAKYRMGINSSGDIGLGPITDSSLAGAVMAVLATGKVGIGSSAPIVTLDLSRKTDALALPSGTNGTRPAGVNGMIRYNSASNAIEGYVNDAWGSIGGGGSLSSLTAAVGTNTIDNGNYAQVWNWNSLTTGTALTLSSSSATSGALLNLTNTGSGNSAYGIYSVNTDAANSGTNIYAENDGTGYGVASYQHGAGNAIYGEADGSGAGVVGAALGVGNDAFGIAGVNGDPGNTGTGVYGENDSGGFATGVQGEMTDPGNSGYGIYGVNDGASSGVGVQGEMTNSGNVGYAGYFNNNATGTAIGVYGDMTNGSNTGYAAYFANNSATGWGVYSAGTSPNYFKGNVGIGDTWAPFPLSVTGNIATSGHLILGPTIPSSAATLPAAPLAIMAAVASATTYNSNPGIFLSSDYGSGYEVGIQFGGWTGSAYSTRMAISNPQDGVGNRLGFGTSSTELMTLTAGGNVGIGTAAPLALLDVNGTTAMLVPRGTTGQEPAGVNGMLRYNTTTKAFEGYANNAWGSIGGGGGTVTLGTSATVNNPQVTSDITSGLFSPAGSTVAIATNGLERLRVDPSGNIGIGTTVPGNKLDVYGSVAIGTAYSGTVAPTDGLIVSGKVGIGTSVAASMMSLGAGQLTFPNQTNAAISSGIEQNNFNQLQFNGAGSGFSFRGSSNAVFMTMTNGPLIGIGTGTPLASFDIGTMTDAMIVPKGTTGQEPAGINGMLRYNTTTNAFEGYANNAWGSIGGGGGAIALGTSATVNNPQVASDITSGLFSPMGSTVAIATNGTQRLTVGPTGNVGIGTATPSYTLDVYKDFGASPGLRIFNTSASDGRASMEFTDNLTTSQTWDLGIDPGGGTSKAFQLRNITGGTYPLTVLASGQVGIGTATPVSPLTLYTPTTTSTTIGAKENRIFLYNNSVTSNSGSEIVVGTGDTPTGRYAAFGTAIQSNGSGAASGDVYIATKANGATSDTTLTPKIYVQAAGNVGIGTTAPLDTMDIRVSNSKYGLRITDTTSGDGIQFQGYYPAINFNSYNDGTNARAIGAGYTAQMDINPSNGYIFFFTGDNPGAGAVTTLSQRMVITPAGNVGIGTTTPLYPLQVEGQNPLTLENTSAAANAYSQLTFNAGTAKAYMWAANPASTSWAGASSLNLQASGNIGFYAGGALSTEITGAGIQLMSGSNLYLSGSTVYGLKGNDGYFDTINTGSTNDPLEINYRVAGPTKICASVACATYSALFDTSGNVTMPGTLSVGAYGGITSAAGTYGSINLTGDKGGYYGVTFGPAGTPYGELMFDTAGNGGLYYQGVAWAYYTTKATNDFSVGYTTDCGYQLCVNGDAYLTGGWVRTTGSTGWYNQTYAIGMYAVDSTYVRTYGGADLLAAGYFHSSDRRLKHDIHDFDRKGLDVVDGLRTVHFKWNKDNKEDYGVIAQEVKKVLPEVVQHDDQGWLQVSYDKLVLPCIEAIKELHAMVKDLQTKVADLFKWKSDADARMAAIEQQMHDLEASNKALQAQNRELGQKLQHVIARAHHAVKPLATPIALPAH